MPTRKSGRKPGTKSYRDKNESQTESENDAENGTEESEDDVDGSGISSSGLQRKPLASIKSSAPTSPHLMRSGKIRTLSSNNSSTASDLDSATSPSWESPPSQTGRGKAYSYSKDLYEPDSSVASGSDYGASPTSTNTDPSFGSPCQSRYENATPSRSTDNNTIDQNSLNVPLMVLIAIIVAFVSILVFFAKKSEPVTSFNQFQTFVQNIDNFKLQFPAQENRFWRTVKASGKHVLNDSNPEYPAILLFVTKSKPNDDQFDVGSCLAQKISAEFDSANSGAPIVDVGKLTAGSSQKQKMEFDDQLRNVLEKNYKSVIVEHLELLSPSAALLLHGYCDNDNAPYKDVMIILVLHVENSNISPQAAEAQLKRSWERDLETDKVDALMSRVANNIVIVHPESMDSSSYCN